MIRNFLNSSFFRQSAWMMAATLISGGCMSLVQIIATKMPKGEALTFSMLVDLGAQLTIPVPPPRPAMPAPEGGAEGIGCETASGGRR